MYIHLQVALEEIQTWKSRIQSLCEEVSRGKQQLQAGEQNRKAEMDNNRGANRERDKERGRDWEREGGGGGDALVA